MATHVQIVEISAAERKVQVRGRDMIRGRSLASLIEEFGGFEGELEAPITKTRHRISLVPWRERDPSSTWLDVMFVDDKRGSA